jgi:hypothetical protein
MKQILAERKILGKRSNAEKFPITIRIGEPYEHNMGSWACPTALDGLHSKLADIHGVDSFQALMLGISLIKNLLVSFEEEGGELWTLDESERISVEDIFTSGFGL